MQQGDERPAPGQPDRRLRRRVATADDADLGRAASLTLERARGIEDAEALVLVEVRNGEAPVVGAGGDDDAAGDDLMPLLEPDEVGVDARLERLGAVGSRRAGLELARLGDRPARQLGAADPGREAEVVLDPARGARLATEPGALDDQGVKPFRGAVDGRAEAGRAGADDEQIDLFACSELEADPERPRELAVARSIQFDPAGQPDKGKLVRIDPVDEDR